MSRVSENSGTAALNFAINKAKSKLENLQLKGSTLKQLTRPSDNPMSNIESLSINSIRNTNKQYLKNNDFALLHLNVTEKTLENLTDLLVRAKELAIAQSSDIYNEGIRKNIAHDVIQIRNQVLALANKRIGNKYIFAGYKILNPPFNVEGEYFGDKGKHTLEISKDFFIPININGEDVFFLSGDTSKKVERPLEAFPEIKSKKVNKSEQSDLNKDDDVIIENARRELASVNESSDKQFEKRENIFSLLATFITALENDDPKLIQGILEKFDNSISRIITLRTRLGSLTNSVASAQGSLESENIDHAARNSKLVDADVAELFADLTKQQEVLKTTYQSAKGVFNKNLLSFIN